MAAARKRIAELETEVAIHRRATELLKEAVFPKERFAAIQAMAEEGLPIQVACRLLEVSESGFYQWRSRSPSARELRHVWLTELIRQVHHDSRGTYGAWRVHAELTLARGVSVGPQRGGDADAPRRPQGPARHKRPRTRPQTPIASDLVDRKFSRDQPDRLWVTDITEHPTREGKVYCCVVLGTYSRRVVGWSIDSTQTAALVTNAIGMAVNNRRPTSGTVIHSDHGVQFTSWAFTQPVTDAGLVASMGSIGDCYDNAVIESFSGRMQTELLNRRRWRTRLEPTNAIFEYLEIFHNRQRRHSALSMLTPIEYEKPHTPAIA